MDNPDLRSDLAPLSDFFKHYTAYDIMPVSAKTITIDARISLYRAYRILGENHTSTAYIWDEETQKLLGVFTASDFMKAVLALHGRFFSADAKETPYEFIQRHYPQALQSHENITILHLLNFITIKSSKIAAIKSQADHGRAEPLFVFGDPDITLHEALSTMIQKAVHRLPIIDDNGTVICSITYRVAVKFLVSKFRLPTKVLQHKLLALNIGDRNPLRITPETTLYDTLRIMFSNNLSAVPVVDGETDHLLNVFSKYDVSALSLNPDLINLNNVVQVIIEARPSFLEGLTILGTDATLAEALKLFAQKNLHRVFVADVHDGNRLVMVVSLRHLLAFITSLITSEDIQPNENEEENDATYM